MRRRALQILARGHGAGTRGGAGEDDRLRHLGQGEFALQHGRRRGKGRHARDDLIFDAERIEPPHLLGDGAVERRIAGMEPRHVEPLGRGRGNLGDDGVERERRAVSTMRASPRASAITSRGTSEPA